MIIQEMKYNGYMITVFDSTDGIYCWIAVGDKDVDATDYYRETDNAISQAKQMIDFMAE